MILLLTVSQSFRQPLAFDFFNPATDLQSGKPPVSPSTSIGRHTEQGSANSGPMTQPLRRTESLSHPHRASFLSFPPPGPLLSPARSRTHFGSANVRERSPFVRTTGEGGRPIGMCVDVGRRCTKLTKVDTGGSRSLSREDIAQELRRRRDSQEDLNAQRGTHTLIPPSHS